MNSILRTVTFLGLVACGLNALAQNTPPASDPPVGDPPANVAPANPAPTETPTAVETPAAAAPAPTPAGDAAQSPAVTPPAAPDVAPAAAAAPTPVAVEEPAPVVTKLIAANDTPAATPPAAATPPVGTQAAAVIPLIVMDDVPLTDAIKNLARQAGLNYMMDPKIGFGQPGPDGKIVPQPSVSIRWENVTAEQALNALLNNHTLQLVDEPRTHIARVTTKDPAAPDPLVTQIIQLKYASPSNIVGNVQAALTDRRSKVMGDTRTSQLVVVATEKEMQGVVQLVDKLDTQTKQVLIEAKLIETSLNPESFKGVNWNGTLQGQQIAFGNNLQTGPVPSESVNAPLATAWPKLMLDTAKGFNPATAFLDLNGVNAVLSFINNESTSKVISSPRSVTLDNEPAYISVTRAQPIFKNTAGTQGSPGGSEVTYTNIGVILTVTPRISANNFVNLHVVPEVSRVDGTSRKVVAGTINEADIYAIRKVDTRVMIPSGNTLVLGGLVSDAISDDTTKVPLLGDIPYLGALFRSSDKKRSKSNLLIFITPTIVTDDDYQPTVSTYMKTPVPTSDSVDQDWSAWDTTTPIDWSKPATVKSAFHDMNADWSGDTDH